MTWFLPLQKASWASRPAMLTALAQQYGMTENRRLQNRRNYAGGRNGRQEKRPGRDLAKHDRRDGEGIQLLRQSGDGLAGILQGRQPGWRGHRGRAKAARRSDGEISGRHESAEPGTDGQHGRAAAVDRKPVERDQGAIASGPEQSRRAAEWIGRCAQAAAHKTSAVGGRRAKMNASAGPSVAGLDLSAIPARIQSEVQRAIQRSIKGVEYIASSGPSLGSTAKDILHVRGTMNLYHYRPLAEEIYRVPILIVMATTNRGYILDMVPGQSFIEFLLKRGYDVYMLAWTAPKPEEKNLRMEDYVLDFIPDCVRRVQQDSGETDVTVIGYCFGGVLSLLYGSIFADGPMKNLICFTTPVDFREMKLFQNFSDRRYFDVDRLIDSVGNVPPEMILSSFEMLRPASRAAGQVQLWENIWNDEYVKSYRMFDRWATDILPLSGEYFRCITKDLMWDNRLYEGTMSVGGYTVDLSKIKVPILHAVAEHDHIVPYDAAKPLIQKIGSTDKEEVMLKGGHVSLVAGANAIKRLWPKLDSWLGERST